MGFNGSAACNFVASFAFAVPYYAGRTHLTASSRQIGDQISVEDSLRADVYRLLAALLARPADKETLKAVSGLVGDETAMGQGYSALAALASKRSAQQVAEEYQDLFIGIGRGEVLPFGSYYLTGFLNEKPLARLRNAMAEFGIKRDPDIKEPEDHIAALMDMMAGLISGDFGKPADTAAQRKFFNDHISRWAGHCFSDIEKAKNAVFYQPVGTIGRLFMEIEQAAFEME